MLKIKRLKGRKNFQRVFKEGLKLEKENFDIYFLPSFDFPLGFSVIVSSKFGNAVKRNKVKRQAKSIIYKNWKDFLPLCGNIIIFFKKNLNLNYQELKKALVDSFQEVSLCLQKLH